MSISSNLTKLTTDITNAYTSIENKGGTTPANKNTNNLPTAIDSIEVIEQATAEGESLSLTNTKAMPYKDYVVEGKSEQATRSGKNLLNNTATSQTISGVTFTVNEDGSVTCNGTATNNIFFSLTENNSIESIILNGCPAGGSGNSYLIRAIDTNGRVLKTDFGEGTEVFNLINARIQIRIAKDYICNNLTFYPMIRLATIEDDTYEPFGASPSPDYPSEINSVADDVNLWNGDATNLNNVTYSNGVVTQIQADTATNIIWKVNFYNNSTYVKQILTTKNDTGIITFKINKDNTFNSITFGLDGASRDTTMRISLANLEDNKTYTLSFNVTNVTQGSISWQDIKIQEGTTATPYSPYNQGTVTIKQRGKNLWNEELENAEYDTNGNKSTSTIWLVNKQGIEVNPNTTYTVSQQQTPSQYRIICFNNNTFLDRINNVHNTTEGYKNYTFTTPANCNKIYIQFRSIIENINQGSYVMIPSDITNIQLEQGSTATTYEPYQANDFIFQTSPLRSLPNGVKDTIEEDGIHRRVGRVVLDGSENNWAVYAQGFQYTYYISISDCKIGYQKSLCSHFKNSNQTWEPANGKVGQYSDHPTITNKYFNTDKSTLASWKEWLQQNPIILQYELEQEIIEPLTQNQATTMLDIIHTGSYEGTTNIHTDEDVKPTMKVGYYKKG